MFKRILIVLVFVFLGAFLYYLGTLNLHKSILVKKTTIKSKVIIPPTITPFPSINPFDSLREVKSGVEYSDKVYGISFTYPQDYSLNGTRCNISIKKFSQLPHSPMWNYIHIAVVSKDKPGECEWEGHSGQNKKYITLKTAKIGQTIITSDSMPEYFKYTRLPDESINKNVFQHFVSYKVWESSENTSEHVFKLESNNYTLWIMGLTNEDISQPDSISFITLKKLVSSLHIVTSQ